MAYNKADFDKQVDTIIPDGFTRINSYCKFERRFSDRVETIYYSHNDYFPHGVYFKGVIVHTSFTKVENYIKSFFERKKLIKRAGETTIQKSFVNLKDINYKVFNTEIKDLKSFMNVAAEIIKIVDTEAILFFEKYNTLEKVFEATEVMPLEEMANFIGQPLPLRRMIIKKLCHDPRYEEYANMVIDYYKSENNPDAEIAEALHAELSTR